MKKDTLLNKLRYVLERQFIRGTRYQLLVMALLVLVISVMGGLLAFGTGDEDGLLDTIWWAFLRLTDPGYLGDDEGAWRRVVSTLLTVSGYVVFMGALIAILTQWLGAQMRLLERGLTPVSLSGHIVILGWTDRTLPLVRELVAAEGRVKRFLLRVGGAGRLRLVVLAEELTPEIAETLRNDPALSASLGSIILRSGSSLSNEHLQRAACDRAAAIIVPARRTSGALSLSSDVETIKVLLALNSQGNRQSGSMPYVVAEIQSPAKFSVARRAYQGPLEVVAGDVSISRLMVQNIRHPGLSRVYNELLSHGIGQNFYIVRDLGVEGLTVAEVRRRLASGILCGRVQGTPERFQVQMNLRPEVLLNREDALVILASSLQEASTMRLVKPNTEPVVVTASSEGRVKVNRRVLVVGWSRKIPLLLREFATYNDGETRLEVLSSRPVAEREQILSEQGIPAGITLQHRVAEVTSEQQWRQLTLTDYDSIVFLSSDRWQSDEEADARTLVSYLLMQGALEAREARTRGPQQLLELAEPGNEPLLADRQGETLISPMLSSHFMVQVALRREMRSVFDALFSAGGPEITLYSPGELNLALETMPWSEVVRVIEQRGETALGVVVENHQDGQLQLNPQGDPPLTLTIDDRIVVLTTDCQH
ncbi:MAG: CASTOR/POLLUX-related putative ion channel [Saccharospirillum sp.]